jgi:hypothetical protein
MDVKIIGVMIPMVAVIGAFITVVYLRKFQNAERMAMIEKGIGPDLFGRNRDTSLPLRFSLLLIGAGIGLLMGYGLDRLFNMEEIAYFSMLFLFGGLGLGAAYLVEEQKSKQQ